MKKERNIRLEVRLTEDELNLLISYSNGYKSMSEFVRTRLFRKGNLTNPVELLRHMDQISYEINRVGNNINQIAKYLNQGNVANQDLLTEYNRLLSKYVQSQNDLNSVFKKIIAL